MCISVTLSLLAIGLTDEDDSSDDEKDKDKKDAKKEPSKKEGKQLKPGEKKDIPPHWVVSNISVCVVP